jgi:hypothetical protein
MVAGDWLRAGGLSLEMAGVGAAGGRPAVNRLDSFVCHPQRSISFPGSFAG